jgi:hypothetical protein
MKKFLRKIHRETNAFMVLPLILAWAICSDVNWSRLFAEVNQRNGIAITTASTLNGKTPNSQVNGFALASGAVSNLPAPVLWLIADDISGSDGATITNWPAAIGEDAGLFNGSATGPTLKTSVLNGHDVLRFDGVDNLMQVTNIPSSGFPDSTVLVVFVRRSATSVGAGDFSFAESSTYYNYLGSALRTDTRFQFGVTDSTTPVTQATNVVYAALIRSDGASYYNSTLQSSVTPSYSSVTDASHFVIGGMQFPVAVQGQNDYAEILVWDVQLTDQEMTWARAYAKNKYDP